MKDDIIPPTPLPAHYELALLQAAGRVLHDKKGERKEEILSNSFPGLPPTTTCSCHYEQRNDGEWVGLLCFQVPKTGRKTELVGPAKEILYKEYAHKLPSNTLRLDDNFLNRLLPMLEASARKAELKFAPLMLGT